MVRELLPAVEDLSAAAMEVLVIAMRVVRHGPESGAPADACFANGPSATTPIGAAAKAPPMPDATRHVTRRDGRLEGEPDAEPGGEALDARARAEKDTQRDLTSLSGPIPDEPDGERDEDAS